MAGHESASIAGSSRPLISPLKWKAEFAPCLAIISSNARSTRGEYAGRSGVCGADDEPCDAPCDAPCDDEDDALGTGHAAAMRSVRSAGPLSAAAIAAAA